MIRELTIVTSQGVKIHRLGGSVNDHEIVEIKISQLTFTGDPFDHYCGYADDGSMLFSVNCLVPCEIEYL